MTSKPRPVSRLRRILRIVVTAGLGIVALVAALAITTVLTAPGRRGLEGAEQRASAWKGQPPLRELADRVGVRFGSAVMARDLRGDPRYGPLLAREFNSLTPFVEMKWGTIHPEPDRYDFSQADELMAFAQAHKMRVRGHALVYGQVVNPPNPAYLSRITEAGVLRALMAEHITRTLGHVFSLGLTYDEASELERQAKTYGEITSACLAVPACQGVTLWTFTDRYPTTIETLTHLDDIPLIFDDDYRPQPAAFRLWQVLSSATPRGAALATFD